MTGMLLGSMWEYAGSYSFGRPRKRSIVTMKDYLNKIGLYVRQSRIG